MIAAPAGRSPHRLTAPAVTTVLIAGTVALAHGLTPIGITFGAVAALALLLATAAESNDVLARGARTAAAALVLAMTPARGGRRNARVRTTATA